MKPTRLLLAAGFAVATVIALTTPALASHGRPAQATSPGITIDPQTPDVGYVAAKPGKATAFATSPRAGPCHLSTHAPTMRPITPTQPFRSVRSAAL